MFFYIQNLIYLILLLRIRILVDHWFIYNCFYLIKKLSFRVFIDLTKKSNKNYYWLKITYINCVMRKQFQEYLYLEPLENIDTIEIKDEKCYKKSHTIVKIDMKFKNSDIKNLR